MATIASEIVEFVIWVSIVLMHAAERIVRTMLEWVLVAGTWLALLVVAAVMSCQRGGLPWTDPSDARATSRSPDTSARRARRR